MLFVFFAVCWACGWCFDHNRPDLGILIGVLFAGFWLLDSWVDTVRRRRR
jgi:hypothetical protein